MFSSDSIFLHLYLSKSVGKHGTHVCVCPSAQQVQPTDRFVYPCMLVCMLLYPCQRVYVMHKSQVLGTEFTQSAVLSLPIPPPRSSSRPPTWACSTPWPRVPWSRPGVTSVDFTQSGNLSHKHVNIVRSGSVFFIAVGPVPPRQSSVTRRMT